MHPWGPPSEGAVACLHALAQHGDMLPRRALIGVLRQDGVPLARSECPRALYVALENLVGPLLEGGLVAERAVGGVKLIHTTEEGRGVLDGFDTGGTEDEGITTDKAIR